MLKVVSVDERIKFKSSRVCCIPGSDEKVAEAIVMFPETDFEMFKGQLDGQIDCCTCIHSTERNLTDIGLAQVQIVAVWYSKKPPGELCLLSHSAEEGEEMQLGSWTVDCSGDVPPVDDTLMLAVRTINLQKLVLQGASLGTNEDWILESLATANAFRERHGAPPLKWSVKAAEIARKTADLLGRAQGRNSISRVESAQTVDAFKHGYGMSVHHPGDLKIGEMISARTAFSHWYSQLFNPGYDFAKPGKLPGTDDFSQLVWTETTHVGLDCGSMGKGYIVACYAPPGNINGQYQNNVLPLGSPSKMSPEDRRSLAKEKFSAFDVDGSNGLTCRELEKMLRVLDPTFTHQEVEVVMRFADKNGNGVVDFCEFLDWCCSSDAGPRSPRRMLVKG
eukprot:gnl/MRDRNA2_/MRDRNA2_97561_c0_seq1.p1 gnl/MRDRNA2_/MRDRNA2_97561_c0~~gnl/MRDRNA2_/MRDRNA2_97561_c0_seq1.p1  ORF type:complete len:392 (+),score=73.45 gnl/MRDRNA2_/MRDRNA2_97561_c0_seq1:72-1247(+)